MTENAVCIYHGNCQDGFASLWVFDKILGKKFDNVYYPKGIYGEPCPYVKDKHVYILDFSYSASIMQHIIDDCKSLTVFDHHKTAKDNFVGLDYKNKTVNITFDMYRSGAGITWDELTKYAPRPLIIKAIEDRDLWQFNYSYTGALTAYLFAQPYSIKVWDELQLKFEADRFAIENSMPNKFVELGQAIIDAKLADINTIIDTQLYYTKFGNYINIDKLPCLNIPITHGSEACNIILKDYKVDVAMYYCISKRGAYVGFRSKKNTVDVAKIAEAFGGGGHREAAAFTLPLNFSNKQDENLWSLIKTPI
jgi:oligoribonuclease NrnB/cAMP/cGMP phosphodiesterase (DHH superfamily)